MGYTPPSFCESQVIFIPKQGKTDYSLPKSYRPISLASCLLKVLEKLILLHLEGGILRTNPLHPAQHAFRRGRGCDTALSFMADRIESSVLRGEHVIGAYLDISGTFDNLSLEAAVRGLRQRGIPDTICGWYEQYLFNRTATATLGGCSKTVSLTRGTPQGGHP